jgi:two-component system, sensor histidine kinase LadS
MPVSIHPAPRFHLASLLPALIRVVRMLLPWLVAVQVLHVNAASLESLPSEPLGRWMEVMSEKWRPLPIGEAIEQLRRGAFSRGHEEVLKFGIGARPVWLHLAVDNNSQYPVERRLQVENSWLDRIDVYIVNHGQVIDHMTAGDGEATAQHPLPGLGYVFEVTIPPGQSDIMLRVATPDPLLVPVRLLDSTQLVALQRQYDYGYGLLYGFLLALIAYNAMLYIGLHERSYLDYTLYLGSFVLLHLSYTGHGYTWLWPASTFIQQYAIPMMMVVFGCLGLRFADGFLNLRQHALGIHRLIWWISLSGLLLVSLMIAMERQQNAVLLAFIFVLLFSILMVWLGIIAIRHGQVAGRYFLAAALTAMAGTSTTALAVWFGLSYSPIAYHAAGWGVVAEGILLALALAYRMRRYQQARMQAEQLARTDPLTELPNRRAFLEYAGPVWSTALRSKRPLAAMMVDIDFFKAINDNHGHAMGDRVLQAVSHLLSEVCRGGDITARWGGEEFIILLPETNAAQAAQLAERLRTKISALRLGSQRKPIRFSASFGIAERNEHESLDQLIHEADEWLYHAKESGRNRVAGPRELQPAI